MILVFLFWLWFFNGLYLEPVSREVVLALAVAATFFVQDMARFARWLGTR